MITLGSAKDYAVLGLKGTFINLSLVTVNGNVGVSQGGSVKNMAPSVINGDVFEFAAGQYSGPGKLSGSLHVNPVLLNQNDADALAASATAAGLTPDFTLGTVNSNTTITATPASRADGVTVVNINGDVNKSITLSGNASDVFVINISGSINLGGSSTLGLSGGVTSNHVLWNLPGSGGSINTHVGNVLYGTILAPNYSYGLDGNFIGELIAGGKSISLLSGAKVSGQGSIPNTATVGMQENDPTPGDNSSSATITFQ